MNQKILVADDSPTIQKVVGITLASTDYELTQAQSEEELFNLLQSDSYDLILLDFNLSEEKEGYELCQMISEKASSSKVIIMLGTFDSVDDGRLSSVGVNEKVIKPFESTKFIQKIADTLSGDSLESDFSLLEMDEEEEHEESDEVDLQGEFDEDSGDDEWSMSGPNGEESSEDEDDDLESMTLDSQTESSNELHAEIQGWGMNVPSIIGGSSDQILPPKMDEDYSEETGEWDTNKLGLTPSDQVEDDDLFEEGVNSFETQSGPQSSLISLDELAEGSDEEDEDIEDTDPQIVIEKQEDDPSLEESLNEETSPDDFWAADESFEESEEEENQITLDPQETEEDDFQINAHQPIDEVGPKLEGDDSSVSNNATLQALNEISQYQGEVGPKLENIPVSVNTDEIIKQVISELKPQIKEMIQEVVLEMSKETIEGVAWEIIPDLAENLIRNEVETLSKRVQEKHSLS